jgi:hypothetical protein
MKVQNVVYVMASPLAGVALFTATIAAPHSERLPDPVATTFAQAFPKGEILKFDAEDEGGVTVFDIEFRDGDIEKETDIASDGTMLEVSMVIAEPAVPAAALAALRQSAGDAALTRIEKVEVSYAIKEGKVAHLLKSMTYYEALLSKDGQHAEVVVSPSGEMVEAPRWGEDDESGKEDQGDE